MILKIDCFLTHWSFLGKVRVLEKHQSANDDFYGSLPSEDASFLWLWNRSIKICIRQWFHCTFGKKKRLLGFQFCLKVGQVLKSWQH